MSRFRHVRFRPRSRGISRFRTFGSDPDVAGFHDFETCRSDPDVADRTPRRARRPPGSAIVALMAAPARMMIQQR